MGKMLRRIYPRLTITVKIALTGHITATVETYHRKTKMESIVIKTRKTA